MFQRRAGAFTVHADLKYNADMYARIYLNNNMDSMSVSSTFIDNRRDLVIKCDILDVKGYEHRDHHSVAGSYIEGRGYPILTV